MMTYIDAVKSELLFHKENTFQEDDLKTIKTQNIQNEALTLQNNLKNQELNANSQNQTQNYSFKKDLKNSLKPEAQQITFFENQKGKENQKKNLNTQPNRTLIIRNGAKPINERVIVTSNNLKLSSEMLGDDFQKRSDLLNKKLESSLQNLQNKKTPNQDNPINQKVKKSNNFVIKTIYIGGGTPSILPVNAIPELLVFIKQNFHLAPQCEITVEANPDSFNLTKAIAWKSEGVNRISFGLQSDDDKVLKELGRVHNFAQFLTAVDNAKKAGFTNINADILLGLPNQTVENAVQTVNNIAKLGLTHISAYGLIVEEGTPFAERVKTGAVVLTSEEQAVAIYNAVVEELKKLGLARYEISNFAKIDNGEKGNFEIFCQFVSDNQMDNLKNNDTSKNFEMKQYQKQLKSKQDYTKFQCLHNLNYWARGEFLGVGLSAYSFMNGEHWDNTLDLNEYLNQPYSRQNLELETKETAMEETIMLALRCENGLDIVKFNQTFDTDFEKIYEKQIKKLLESNLIKIENQHLKILDFEISNAIILNFF